MNRQANTMIKCTRYNHQECDIGLVHLGFGAFHRAHQAVYFDDYMEQTGDLDWGIAAVNLRKQDAVEFSKHSNSNNNYLLKTTTPNGESSLREVRSHIQFEDWSTNTAKAEELLSRQTVKAVSMTVTESGYYLKEDWSLDRDHPVIVAEIKGVEKVSVYAYLAAALKLRMESINVPITILCCDNIRSNGDKLERNFKDYVNAIGEQELAEWLRDNATFPNSMVDRITPNTTNVLREEISMISPEHAETSIQGEDYIQWVIENDFASDFPALSKVGVEIVTDVDPYEEAKIRILNGGHTALCYLGALAGYDTFDQTMNDVKLRQHFFDFETENVLPGLTLDLPFDKTTYRDLIEARFRNTAIADNLARICMDGWSKFPIFIRPTMSSCLQQGISPKYAYKSIASWYVYARHYEQGRTHIEYKEPYWNELNPLLAPGQEETFAKLETLWSDLPNKYEEFVPELLLAIKKMEETWPISA